MSGLSDLILDTAIAPRLAQGGKRQVLQALVEVTAAAAGLDPRPVLEAVLLRERLGPTGLVEGVAIPHARVEGLDRPVCGFARLDPPVDFGAIDGRPADLLALLLSPAGHGGDHLKALAKIARFLSRADTRERLRLARGADDLGTLLRAGRQSDAA